MSRVPGYDGCSIGYSSRNKEVFVFKNSLKNWALGYTLYGKTGKIKINDYHGKSVEIKQKERKRRCRICQIK